jgi:hypothetical protein
MSNEQWLKGLRTPQTPRSRLLNTRYSSSKGDLDEEGAGGTLITAPAPQAEPSLAAAAGSLASATRRTPRVAGAWERPWKDTVRRCLHAHAACSRLRAPLGHLRHCCCCCLAAVTTTGGWSVCQGVRAAARAICPHVSLCAHALQGGLTPGMRGTPRARSALAAGRPPVPRQGSGTEDADSVAGSDDASVATEEDNAAGAGSFSREGDSVQVFVRVRPVNAAEAAEGACWGVARQFVAPCDSTCPSGNHTVRAQRVDTTLPAQRHTLLCACSRPVRLHAHLWRPHAVRGPEAAPRSVHIQV